MPKRPTATWSNNTKEVMKSVQLFICSGWSLLPTVLHLMSAWCATSQLQGRHRKTWFDCHLIRAVALSKLSLKQNPLKEKGLMGCPVISLKHCPIQKSVDLKFGPLVQMMRFYSGLPGTDCNQSWKASRGLQTVKWSFWDYQSSKPQSVNKHSY